jgi:hypothetical protein
MKLIGCKYMRNQLVSQIYFQFFLRENVGKFKVVGCRCNQLFSLPFIFKFIQSFIPAVFQLRQSLRVGAKYSSLHLQAAESRLCFLFRIRIEQVRPAPLNNRVGGTGNNPVPSSHTTVRTGLVYGGLLD